MTTLGLIGFVSLALVTLYFTLTAIGSSLAEIGFSGELKLSWILIIPAILLWVLLLWLQPFTIIWKI